MVQPGRNWRDTGGENAESTGERRLTPIRPAGRPAVTSPHGLPAPVRKAAKAVAVGAALQVGASLAMRYLAGQSARRAALSVASRRLQAAPRTRPAIVDAEAEAGPADGDIVSETLVVRRVWIRRRRDG